MVLCASTLHHRIVALYAYYSYVPCNNLRISRSGEAKPAWVLLPLVDHASMQTVAAFHVSFMRFSFALNLMQSNIELQSRNSSATVLTHVCIGKVHAYAQF